MAEPTRYFFIHLQKTGGTALFQRLRQAVGPEAVYPGARDQGDVTAVIDVDHLLKRFNADRAAMRVITGHFPYCTTSLLGVPIRTFTVLRDPVERTLSLLRRRQTADPRFLGEDLERIYEDNELRPIIRNHMVKMLSLTTDELGSVPLTLTVSFDDGRLERAKRTLEQIDVVGVQEQFDEFCGRLETRFGWDLGPPRFANRTARGPVPDGLRERIRRDNELDHQLYEFAVAMVDRRGQATADVHG